jgi:hypothetical protein
VDNAPGVPAERQHLLALPQPFTAWPDDDLPVDFVRRARSDGSDRQAAYGAAGLRRHVADHVSEFLVIRPGAAGDAFLAIAEAKYSRNGQSTVPKRASLAVSA